MPKGRIYRSKCSKCLQTHEKPTGRHCQWVDVPEEQQTAPAEQAVDLTAALQHIVTTIEGLGERMSAVERNADNRQSMPISDPQLDTSGEAAGIAEPRDSDIPSVAELRRSTALNRQVQKQLAELEFGDEAADLQLGATGQRLRGKKSGAARTVQDTIVNDIDWPHFHIYSPPGAQPMTFERLSVPEFAYGYLHMVDQQGAKFDREVMWDLLNLIMEDAAEFPWANVKNFFWILGSHVENDRAKWSDNDLVQRLRTKYAQKYEVVGKKATPTTTDKPRYCGPFQTGQCQEKGDHAGLRHICAHCLRVKAAPYPHPEKDCRRKLSGEVSKNEKGGD